MEYSFENTVKFVPWSRENIPAGRKVSGVVKDKFIIVYQAFCKEIADYASQNQTFGGEHYDMKRMTWIKPNFLWMMYRSNWATSRNQERILAIFLDLDFFVNTLLKEYRLSFKPKNPEDLERLPYEWKKGGGKGKKDKIVVQWDPHHRPNGSKVENARAIQIGIKGSFNQLFREHIYKIEDITEIVKKIDREGDRKKNEVMVPLEEVVKVESEEISNNILLDK